MSKQVPGVPEGWELVRIAVPRSGEYYVDLHSVQKADAGMLTLRPIVRRIGHTHRPFKNASEFAIHADRWITRKDRGCGRTWRPSYFSDTCVAFTNAYNTTTYQELLDGFEFSDCSPCGIEVKS